MTGFDIIVLAIVGLAAIGGFMRGFVQETLSLAAWILAVFAIHYLHTPLYDWLVGAVGTEPGAAILAFVLLLLIPYAAMKVIVRWTGETPENPVLGPFDRVLGFGFGMVKGAIVVVCAFALLVLGFDSAWGVAGRPTWIQTARTYPLVNAGANQLVDLIGQRRANLRSAEAETDGQ
ncbi:hypothetical protein HME9302_01142 [Alteripontixanthobacter maritimus]|uniref:Colicin V production protein like protein n=1 Tax=Alteripontixanthobacter maritimus TaxID=2161824 RepID=A0A369Q8R3_9SPHN|nr:CvpA family protein [Alteripontixanthobacter maritimus]RDC59945.1 hypothetical protein HME9302_01142 [Alteripontixanthobacter maritimus]